MTTKTFENNQLKLNLNESKTQKSFNWFLILFTLNEKKVFSTVSEKSWLFEGHRIQKLKPQSPRHRALCSHLTW